MISGLIARLRSLWRGIRRRRDVEMEMSEEFRLHMELRAEDLVRSGLSPAEAARRARLEFGSTERYKDQGRSSRGLERVDRLRFSLLDVKLGFRMLAQYPGLTIVGGFAIAFAIWVCAGTFEFLAQVVNPTLPLPNGDRIVALRNWDAEANRAESRALHDFVMWREQLASVEDVGAYRVVERNLITGEGRGEPIPIAEISASAFRVTRVPPLVGRALIADDELPAAPAVVVIGHDLWQSRFAGDAGVVGRAVRIASTQATVVGVMPEGYAFPVAHSIWVPLRLNVLDHERRQGPGIGVFGRLAPGATLEEAQAEVSTLGQRTAADFPQTHRHLRPQVLPWAESILNIPGWFSVGLLSSNLFLVMLLVLICANVALLMFARAASRESEIVVRTALGASRGRIIGQMFAEALVLGGLAAVVGLAAAGFGLRWGLGVVETDLLNGRPLPFWFSRSLSPATVLYTVVLTVLGAVIAGVVPALKLTRGIGSRLKQATAGGGGLRFGGVWTVVIVAQVAVTVAFPAVAFFVRREGTHIRTLDVGFPAAEYLSVRLEMDRESSSAVPDTSRAAFLAHFASRYRELERRLVADPAVTGVTFTSALPRMYHGWNQIEVDEGAVTPLDTVRGHRVSSASIDADYLDVLGTPVLSGRGFRQSDLESGARVVIVNKPFVDLVLGGRNAIGRRVRYVANESSRVPTSDGPWYEIIGVARDIGMTSGYGRAGIYHPLASRGAHPVHMALRVRGDPRSFAPQLRVAATALDPSLRLYRILPLDEVMNAEIELYGFWFRLTLLVSAVALLLSLAGIYAVMSFTVSRRTREIGIRVALGADRRRVALAIFRRPLAQVGLGIAAGGLLVTALMLAMTGGTLSARQVALILAYASLMMGVCALACIVPTRQALRIEPTEALRADG